MNDLKYKGYAIVLQEIPNEITLAFNICGCPYHCKGCHSPYLWDNEGQILSLDINGILNQYSEYISCVCFMGGDWNLNSLELLKKKVENFNLKTAIYSGSDEKEIFNALKSLHFTYIKIGSYKEKLGGLDSEKTNQKMFLLKDNDYIDISKSFIKRGRV